MVDGFVCGFHGVECWSTNETRVLKIQLPNMGLRGPFPMGIRNCTSLQVLDLSRNYLSGPIPFNLGDFIPYVTSLDLSNNNLSGPIPPTIANFTFINVLRLDNNHLIGQIPPEFYQLRRITVFSVANNRLSGPIPTFIGNNFSAESYENNLGLCGRPLKDCNDEDRDDLFLSGFAVGFPLFTIMTVLIMFFASPRLSISNLLATKSSSHKRKVESSLSCNYAFNTQITAMEKFICRLSLEELERITNNFESNNVIGYGNKGVMYKAGFQNDMPLAVKRFHRFESLEKEFLTEIKILGRLRQTNLVPLLGFCFEMKKKFLVYEYMCNGTLHRRLHCMEAWEMGWALRLKIAVGIARGLAWLHHNNILRVAHLKINSKCILLDEDFEPKISNFGDAMILTNANGTSPSSGCNFVVQDSSPYKEDVYSFGILLLELVTGREPSTWIKSPTDHVIDECLMGQGFNDEIQETVRIAENCIHPHTADATSMLQVYQEMRSVGISRNEISVTVHTQNNDEDVQH